MTQPDNASLRAAREADLAALSGLCLRSKAIWGYDPAFMEACRTELTLTPRDLLDSTLQVAQCDGRIVGVAQVTLTGSEASLEKLFVDPSFLGVGIGQLLFEWALTAARKLGARSLAIESDPGAVDFYRRMGARLVGSVPSASIPGRQLPLLTFDLQVST
jgi:GNAT superfamily N-acetyltransferase